MPLIECINGAAQTPVRGTYYSFERDRFGRFVCQVNDERDAAMFLSGAVPYREVPLEPVATDTSQAAIAAATAPVPLTDAELRDLAATAVAPMLHMHDGLIYVLAAWPALVPVSAEMLAMKEPWFTAAEGQMTIVVENGRAQYQIRGTVDDAFLYDLLEGSTFTEPPEAAKPGVGGAGGPNDPPAATDTDNAAEDEPEDMTGDHIEEEPPLLLGSSLLAATFEIGGAVVQLGDIVASAHAAKGCTPDEWNVLPDAERELLLQAELDRRLSAAGAPSEAPATEPAAKPARRPRAKAKAAAKE